MSQSLNRIRSLVSEIDQIQKEGQRSTRSFRFPEIGAPSAPKVLESPAAPSPSVTTSGPLTVSPVPAPSVLKTEEKPEERIPEKTVENPSAPVPRFQEQAESRVKVQWTGAVVLELQLAGGAETVELRRRGDLIEIHFADGKAFHIPFKLVA